MISVIAGPATIDDEGLADAAAANPFPDERPGSNDGHSTGYAGVEVVLAEGLGACAAWVTGHAPKITRVPVDGMMSFFGISRWTALIALIPVQCMGTM